MYIPWLTESTLQQGVLGIANNSYEKNASYWSARNTMDVQTQTNLMRTRHGFIWNELCLMPLTSFSSFPVLINKNATFQQWGPFRSSFPSEEKTLFMYDIISDNMDNKVRKIAKDCYAWVYVKCIWEIRMSLELAVVFLQTWSFLCYLLTEC